MRDVRQILTGDVDAIRRSEISSRDDHCTRRRLAFLTRLRSRSHHELSRFAFYSGDALSLSQRNCKLQYRSSIISKRIPPARFLHRDNKWELSDRQLLRRR